MPEPPPAAWYPDPFGRHELRYWDGSEWTNHVASGGNQDVDPPVNAPPASVAPSIAAGWYPDPVDRHEHRYWDGGEWTHHVASRGTQGIDSVVGDARVSSASPKNPAAPHTPVAPASEGPRAQSVDRASKKIQRQVRKTGIPDRSQVGDEAIFTEPVLVVNQKAKLFGIGAEYEIYNEEGQKIGAVQEVKAGLIKHAMGGGGPSATHRFQIVDPHGKVLLALTRPAVLFKSKMIVVGAKGIVGGVMQKNFMFGNHRFDLESGGQILGSICADDWRAWNFSIQDAAGVEIARITKTWAGWAKERFTRADNYVVQIHRPLGEPLRSLAIAAALAIDTALKQGDQVHGTRRYRRYE